MPRQAKPLSKSPATRDLLAHSALRYDKMLTQLFIKFVNESGYKPKNNSRYLQNTAL
jgi:hypothetical protein